MPPTIIPPFLESVLRRHPAVISAASAATGLLRRMSIKPYHPSVRQREAAAWQRVSSPHSVRCHLFREKGNGPTPTIVIAGFVPDATEVMEFQRRLLRSYGNIYYLNYPRNGFSPEMFSAQLGDLIEDINKRGEQPILFSISFGSGLLARFLQERESAEKPRIRGIVMVSPVFCTEDLVRPDGERKGGVRILESNLRRILKADVDAGDDVNRQMERARRCFQSLFEAGAENRALTGRHMAIRGKIMEVIEKTSCRGGYDRVLALKDFSRPDVSRPLFNGPLLALLAETEEAMLVPGSPGLAALRDPETRRGLFPNGTMETVVSPNADDTVAHASLIFHHHCYNPLLESWYDRVDEPGLVAAI
jgi:hypothetical protein